MEARGRTCILIVPSWIRFHSTTTGAPAGQLMKRPVAAGSRDHPGLPELRAGSTDLPLVVGEPRGWVCKDERGTQGVGRGAWAVKKCFSDGGQLS